MTASMRQSQEWFARTVMHEGRLEDFVSELDAASYVDKGPRESRLERVGVYHEGYRARLVECLADDYPAVEYALGREAFAEMCSSYISAHPSRSPNLNAFGRHMPAFVLERGGVNAKFLRDLAVLEWTIVETIHAAPTPVLDVESLANVPDDRWPDVRLTPSGAVRLLAFRYPANRFFQAFREDRSPRIPEPEPAATAVYRSGYAIWRMDLEPAMRALLDALLAGSSLGQALELVASDIESEGAVMAAFRDWVSAGFFSAIRIDE